MWVAGWLRRTEEPQETTNAESGTVTIGGSTAGVLSRGEERNVPLASPGGYAWRPKNGERVLVIKGGPGGEEQCVCGGKQAAVPKGMQPGEVYIYGPKGSNVYLQKDGTIELTGRISIRGQFLVNGEPYKPCTCGGGL